MKKILFAIASAAFAAVATDLKKRRNNCKNYLLIRKDKKGNPFK